VDFKQQQKSDSKPRQKTTPRNLNETNKQTQGIHASGRDHKRIADCRQGKPWPAARLVTVECAFSSHDVAAVAAVVAVDIVEVIVGIAAMVIVDSVAVVVAGTAVVVVVVVVDTAAAVDVAK
jgi:hypothetical protein